MLGNDVVLVFLAGLALYWSWFLFGYGFWDRLFLIWSFEGLIRWAQEGGSELLAMGCLYLDCLFCRPV